MSIKCTEVDNYSISLDFYNSIRQVADDTLKYIKNFKSATFDYYKKLISINSSYGSKIQNSNNNKNTFQIISLTNKIPSLIQNNIEQYKLLLESSESKLKTFENYLKEKADEIKKYQKEFNESLSELTKKYNELQKSKTNYLNSIAKTETSIKKFYTSQKKIENFENGVLITEKFTENDYNNLKEQIKNEINNKNNLIKTAKKNENDYQLIDTTTQQIEKKFKENSIKLKEKIKTVTCNLTEEIKNLLHFFFNAFQNCYKKPIELNDKNIILFSELNESKLTEDLINASYLDNNFLKHPQIKNYNLQSFTENIDTDKSSKLPILQRKKTIEKIEDGIDEMKFYSDDVIYNTIMEILNNFTLVEKEKDFDIEREKIKHKAKKITEKILINAANNISENPNNNYIKSVSEEEITELKKLLNDHCCRVIFLQKLSDFRTKGKFILSEKDYNLFCELFNTICDTVRRDLDYHTAELIIILSATYYINENNKKKYLQYSIESNDLFKNKQFWEEFLTYSITKEITKTLKRDEKTKETKNASDSKLSNIVFAQLLTLIDNMHEYGLNSDDIREILGPKIKFYKLNEDLKKTINDVIEAKEVETKLRKEMEIREKKAKEESKKEENKKEENKQENNKQEENKQEENNKEENKQEENKQEENKQEENNKE